MSHPYSWNFADGEMPEELLDLAVGNYKGSRIEIAEFDGDLYGAIDGFEFKIGWVRGGYDDAAEVLELNRGLEGAVGHMLAEVVAEIAAMDGEQFDSIFVEA